MGTVLWHVTMSLDGLIAGPGDAMSWVLRYADPNPAVDEVISTTGAVLAVRLSARLGTPVARTLDAPPAVLLPVFHETLLFLAGLAVLAGLLSTVRVRTK